MQLHRPVLLSEVIDHLQPEPNQVFVDGTVGLGGHAEEILKRVLPVVPPSKQGVYMLAFDKDADNLALAKSHLAKYGDAVVFVNDSFANMKARAYDHHLENVNGILLDLGFSSVHVDDPERGFSFQKTGPLDMRYDKRAGHPSLREGRGQTAADIVNEWDEDELARMFRVYGEETHARPIAQMIVKRRKKRLFETTTDLAEAIADLFPRRGKIHPATQVFQALRIAVNHELEDLERVLPDAVELLAPGGHLAIITFHSLEDRIVKRFFAENQKISIVNKRVITPTKSEVQRNPRARSAKLRVAVKY